MYPLYIRVHVAMYPHALGCVAIYTWPCIHMHVTMYPHACGHGIHVQNVMHNFVMRYEPQQRILLCAMGHSAMGHGAESLTAAQNHMNFIYKLTTIFKGTVGPKNFTFIKCSTQGLYHHA